MMFVLLFGCVPGHHSVKNTRAKGKQFLTVPAKNTCDGGGYFHKMTYTKGEEYNDKLSTAVLQSNASQAAVTHHCRPPLHTLLLCTCCSPRLATIPPPPCVHSVHQDTTTGVAQVGLWLSQCQEPRRVHPAHSHGAVPGATEGKRVKTAHDVTLTSSSNSKLVCTNTQTYKHTITHRHHS